MFDRRFFTSKLGIAAMISVLMMITFNVYAMSHQLAPSAGGTETAGPVMGLPLVVLA